MTAKEISVLNYVNANKLAYTEQIANALSISESSVRRALDKLNQSKKIIRFHGGASAMTEMEHQSTLLARYEVNASVKERLAKAAADMIGQAKTIVLLGGTTIAGICKYLAYKPHLITVITNSTLVMDQLKYVQGITLIVLGGVYDANEAEMQGALTLYNLQFLNADVLFTGCTAFDENQGFFTQQINAIAFYQSCFKMAKRVYMVADSTKWGHRETAVIAHCTDVHDLITDDGLPAEAAERLRQQGITVHTVASERSKQKNEQNRNNQELS